MSLRYGALLLLSLGCDANRERRIAASMAELCRAEESLRALPKSTRRFRRRWRL